jgi:putative (di)nucleoside polyphosphate hydrolase
MQNKEPPVSKKKSELAYRPCVGVMLINRQGLVWIGRRADMPNDEGSGQWWQMPQGGIDKGEDPAKAALRELYEETSVTSADVIAASPNWYKYDLPSHLIGKSWGGKYRGQTQKWFALRFTGEDSEVDLNPPGHKREFDQWRWAKMDEIMGVIVPFKREVYEKVLSDFRHLGA